MSNSIIEVNNLSKSYTISHEGWERYTSLRDVMAQKAKKVFSFPGWKSKTVTTKEEFWARPAIHPFGRALKDVSFEIEQGDRIGILAAMFLREGGSKKKIVNLHYS